MKCSVFALLFSLVCFSCDVFAVDTALDRYIAKPDPNYSYFSYSTDRDILYDTYFFYMTSQSWPSSGAVDRKLWTHVIEITVPKIRHSSSPGTAILLVNGGSNGNYPTKTDDQAAIIAQALGSVVIKVNQIPNQPLYFADEDNVARREDAIIAYSFDKFLKTGDEEWPALLPMTKSVVRAMDTIQAFLAERRSIRIDDFIVVGGSKRGWTTWLTAAVDKRIKAIAPASIDLLNMGEQFRRHFEAYGFYAPAIADYVALDLPNRMATPEGQALLSIVDPYAYRERFTMPKIILNSTGDQFFYLIHHNSILRTCRKPSGCATCPIPTTSKVWTWQKVSPPGLTKLMTGRLLHDITGQSKPMALFGLKL
jgi:PhoPQ-activated pathogenicity-related protein